MALILAVLYVVRVISLPAGMAVDLAPPPLYNWAVPPFHQLPDIALSRVGSIAILMHPQGPSWGRTTKVLVVRPDGTQLVLTRPSDRELAVAFGEGPGQGRTTPSYPYASFDSVRLARDGTPFVTIASPFSGAFSGSQTAVFSWNGRRWTNQATDEGNVTIGAVDMPWRAAYNANYWNMVVNLDEANKDPHYHEFWTFLLDGKEQARIGYGEAMAMSGDTVVGYSAGLTQLAKPPPQPSTAWEWLHGKLMKLGAGVAYGVNASHDAVGEDEEALGKAGVPVLWRGGRAIPLSFAKGSALAIGDDGTIVGQVGDDGFLIRGDDAAKTVVKVDSLLAQREWHVSAVYAIAATGRLLAVGHRANEGLCVLILDPK
jgi:hypothetical protein